MAKHKIHIAENYDGLGEHTGIVIITPNNIETEEVVDRISLVKKKHPYMPLVTLLNRVTDKPGWSWHYIRYDAEVRFPPVHRTIHEESIYI